MSSQVYIEPVFPGAFSTPNREFFAGGGTCEWKREVLFFRREYQKAMDRNSFGQGKNDVTACKKSGIACKVLRDDCKRQV